MIGLDLNVFPVNRIGPEKFFKFNTDPQWIILEFLLTIGASSLTGLR